MTANKNNFVHYTDGSISAFKNGVLVELTQIESDPIFYYNIGANKILSKSSDQYTIQNLNKQLRFSYPLWKIDSNKYLIAGKDIVISFEDGTQKNINGYLEIEYCDNEVIKIYNQEITYQTISSKTIIHIQDDIEINLATKIIKKNKKNQMSLENMVIDSDDNVTIVDITEKEEKKDEKEKESQTTTENNNNNQQNENQNNSIENTPPIINGGEGSEDNEEIIDNNIPTIQIPKFKTSEFEITTTGVKTKISIKDEDGLLVEDTIVKIIRMQTGKTAYETVYAMGEYEIELDVQTLTPDTEYVLQVESAYQVEDVRYEKKFVYKRFKTNATGISFKKDVFTNKSMSFIVNFDANSQIARADMVLLGKDGQELQIQEVTNPNIMTGGKTSVEFKGLDANTKYEVKLTNVLYNGQILVNGFDEIQSHITLKDRPVISGTGFEINKRDGKFILKLTNVEDKYNGIQKYRYEVYDTRMQIENSKPVKVIESDKTEITLPIDDTIIRNATYIFKVIAIFDDNEKICEYESEYSEQMRMDGAQFPTVSFEETKITFERIEGSLVIKDKDNTIDLEKDSIFTITYTDSVGKTESFTSQGALRIPVSVNNLRANETYKFAIFGKVDLKDGNEPIDECYIGGAIIKTKEPENLVAEFKQNKNDIKSSFNVEFNINSENENSEELEAKTLTGMEFSIYSGKTIEGEKPQGVLIKKIKVVDKNKKPYESDLKDTYYDDTVMITPAFFGAKNEDFKEEFYTIIVSNAYDYTDYENDLPIIKSMFIVETNGYMPELPTNPENAIDVKTIRNYETEMPNPDLNSSTVVGYNVQANYDNSGGYARKIVYRAINATTNKQVAIVEIEIGTDGIIPSYNFQVENGTHQSVTDIEGLQRGNEYYFTYEMALDLNGDGEIDDIFYPPYIEGEEVLLKSKIVSPEKQEAHIILYPSTSTNNARTYKYLFTDIDNALIKNEMIANIGTKIVDRQLLQTTMNKNFNTINLHNLNNGNLKLTVKQALMKNSKEIDRVLVEEYFEQNINISNIRYTVSLDTNRIVINLQDSNGSNFDIKNLERIAAFQVILKATDGSKVYTSELKELSSSNTISVSFNDIEELINKEIEVSVKAYYDSGLVGYDMKSDYVVYQKAYLQSEDKYYYILNSDGNLVENSDLNGNMYYKTEDTTPNKINIINAVNSKYQNNITLQYSDKGMLYQYGTILQKQIKDTEITCAGDNIIKFDLIIPGISMIDENNELAITSELDKITMKATIIKDQKTEIKDNKIFIDIYETDENGSNSKFVKTVEKQLSEFNGAITIDGLSPKTYYGMKLRLILNVYDKNTGTYRDKEVYLYDVDYEVLGKMYYFSTLTDVGLDYIEVNYEPISYNKKTLNIEYTLQRTMGFDTIKYKLRKYNNSTKKYEPVNIDIPEENAFKKKMTRKVQINPGSIIDFGAKYEIEIIPIAYITDVSGKDIVLELGKKTKEFTLSKLKKPVIAIRGTRVEQEPQNNIEYRITIYDEDKVIVDDNYKVKIFDSNQNDITPETIKDKIFSTSEINKKITIENVKLEEEYTLQVIANVDYENKKTNLKELTKEYKILPANEYGISIGNITASTNEKNAEKIDLMFDQSYKLDEIDKIKYSVYNTSGYASTQNVEFIPKLFTQGGENYYLFTLNEKIEQEGKYYIEIQFIKDTAEQGEIIIENTTVEYVYLSK